MLHQLHNGETPAVLSKDQYEELNYFFTAPQLHNAPELNYSIRDLNAVRKDTYSLSFSMIKEDQFGNAYSVDGSAFVTLRKNGLFKWGIDSVEWKSKYLVAGMFEDLE